MSDQSHETEHDPAGGEQDQMTVHEENSIHVEKWEGIWIRIAVGMIVVFVAGDHRSQPLSFGISVPGATARINPATLNDAGQPLCQPGHPRTGARQVRSLHGRPDVELLAGRIEVPQGSEVTFYLTARDVIHGFKLAGTNVNMMALPGQVSTLKATFDKPGTYNYICHEYCGYVAGAPIGHHTMYGQLTVLPADGASETAQVTE